MNISVCLPLSFVVPKILETSTPEENGFILEAGSKALELSRQEIQQKNFKSALPFLEEKANAEYKKKEQEYLQILKSKEAILESKEHEFKAFSREKENALDLQQQELVRLKAKLNSFAEDINQVRERTREEERKNREEILKAKDERISSLQEVVSTLGESINSLRRTIDEQTRHSMKITQNSTLKGKTGEFEVLDLFDAALKGTSQDYLINRISSTESHSGDIHIQWRGAKLMCECKNYSSTVSKKEVEKFLDDMRDRTEIDIGIFISLNTNIANHTMKGDMDIQRLTDGRYCVYLNNFNTKLQASTNYLDIILIPLLTNLIELRQASSKNDDEDEVELLNGIMVECEESFKYHKKLADNFEKLRLSHIQSFKNFDKDFKDQIEMLKMSVQSSMYRICQRTLKTSLNDTQEQTQEMEKEYIIFKPFENNLTTNQKRFVDTIRKHFKVCVDEKLQATEIRDVLKLAGLSDETISRCRETLLQEDVWRKGSKDTKHLAKIVNNNPV
jgi:hypothetical protein